MTDSALLESLSTLLNASGVQVALSTVSSEGVPTTALGSEYYLSERGTLLFREYLESSATNRDLLYSLWFERPVSVAIASGHNALHLRGVPTHAHVAGPLFQQHYEAAVERDPSSDLATVWEIRIDHVEDASPERRRKEQDIRRPFFTHLDRLVRGVD